MKKTLIFFKNTFLFVSPLALVMTGALVNIRQYSFSLYFIAAILFGILIKESIKWW
jgi:hypothetical protein